MNRKTVSGMMVTLLLIGMLTLVFNIQPVKTETTTIIVPDDYPTIQAAINDASEGDTIFVLSETYYENVVVNKSVSLLGENRETTIIDGRGLGKVVHITDYNVVLSGFTIQNSGTEYMDDMGILVYETSGTYIGYNIITNNYYGIWVENSANNNIYENNIMANSDNGIRLMASSENTISYNNITRSLQGSIMLDASCKNTISFNNLTNNQRGISLQERSSGNDIYENNIGNNDYGINFFSNSSGNSIYENNITANNRYGVYLEISSENTIYHNNFIDNTNQVYWEDSINTWDDGFPSGGNYWSDYKERHPQAEELDGSGIWDTPYVIDENNQDNYPLMNPWSPIPEVRIEIIQPKEGDIFWIEAEPEPKMPTLLCQAKVVGITPDPTVTTEFSWEATLSYKYKTHTREGIVSKSVEYKFFGKGIQGGSWIPDFKNLIVGGEMEITAKAVVDGKPHQDTVRIGIRGKNPTEIAVKKELGQIKYQVICYMESFPKWHQFYPKDFTWQGYPLEEGLPICSHDYGMWDYGYGLVQITWETEIKDIWNWKANIKEGIKRYNEEYEREKNRLIREYNLKPSELQRKEVRERLEEAAYYYYNWGWRPPYYWILEKVDGKWVWKVNPLADSTYAKEAMMWKRQLEEYKKALEEGLPLPDLPPGWGEFVSD